MIVLHDGGESLNRVQFSPHGRMLATSGDKSGLRCWDLNAPNRSRLASQYGTRLFAFSRDGGLLYPSYEGNIYEFSPKTGESTLAFTLDGGAQRCEFLNQDFVLIALRSRWKCRAWRDKEYLWQTQDPIRQYPSIIALSPDGETMVTVTTPRDETTFTFFMPIESDAPTEEIVKKHPRIDIWRTASGRVRHTIEATGKVSGIGFSPDSQTLAWVSQKEVHVCDTSWLDELATLYGKLDFKSAAFDPSGRILATTGNDCAVRLWDTENWHERVAYDWGFGPMWDVTFSADGLIAACCGMAGKIVVWDVDV